MAGKRVALGHKGRGYARRANAGMSGARPARFAPPAGIRLPTPASTGLDGRRQYQAGFSFTPKSNPKA